MLCGKLPMALCPNISGTPLAWPTCSPNTCLATTASVLNLPSASAHHATSDFGVSLRQCPVPCTFLQLVLDPTCPWPGVHLFTKMAEFPTASINVPHATACWSTWRKLRGDGRKKKAVRWCCAPQCWKAIWGPLPFTRRELEGGALRGAQGGTSREASRELQGKASREGLIKGGLQGDLRGLRGALRRSFK